MELKICSDTEENEVCVYVLHNVDLCSTVTSVGIVFASHVYESLPSN